MRQGQHREVEIKLPVENPAKLRATLRGLGARRISRVHERNTLLDTVDRRLAREGKLLRVRWNGPNAVLTFKAPAKRSSRIYKVRQEVEFLLGAPERMLEVLTGLGFYQVFLYEKYRTSYRMRGWPELRVEWDETPIGVFLELEGTPRAIDAVAKRLGYGRKDYVRANYLTLYRRDCAKKGLAPGDMVFGKAKRRGGRKH